MFINNKNLTLIKNFLYIFDCSSILLVYKMTNLNKCACLCGFGSLPAAVHFLGVDIFPVSDIIERTIQKHYSCNVVCIVPR